MIFVDGGSYNKKEIFQLASIDNIVTFLDLYLIIIRSIEISNA